MQRTRQYNGGTIISAGTLRAASATALGATVGGTALTGGTLQLDGVSVAGENLDSNSGSSVLSATGVSNAWTGNILLNVDLDLFVATNLTLNLAGVVSGPGGLIKNQPGLVILSGAAANTHTGTNVVNDGLLHLGKSSGNAIPGPLVIGDGAGGNNSAVVLALTNNMIADASPITLETDGQLNLNGFNDGVGAITMTGGQISTLSTGLLGLGGNVTINDSGGSSFMSGRMTFAGATRTITVAFAANLAVSALIQSTGGFIKTGDGEMLLQGSNSFTGAVTVSDGLLRLVHAHGLGDIRSGTTVNGTGTLQLENNLQVLGEPLILDGPGGAAGHLTINGANPTNLWSGNLTLNSNGVVTTSATFGQLTFSNVISGAGGFTKTGGGIVQFKGSSANTYTGTTTVNDGTLVLAKPSAVNALNGPVIVGVSDPANSDVLRLAGGSQIPNVNAVTVNASGLFDLNSFTDTVGSLAGSGNVSQGGGATADFVVGGDGSTTTFSGVISGPRGFAKNGAGTMTLTGTNTYTGPTTINFGTLIVNGSQPQSPVTVSSGPGAVLSGTGVVGVIVNDLVGTVAPGASPGILTCSNLVFRTNSMFAVELNGPDPGTNYDQLNVRGTNNINRCDLFVSLNFPSALSNQFVIINNDGTDPITGTFDNQPQDSLITGGAEQFRITYAGGTGNDVVLTQVTQNVVSQPVLAIQLLSASAVRLAWPTQFSSFVLQTNSSPVPAGWANLNVPSFIVGTNRVVTNSITNPQRFYRLLFED